VYDVSVEIYLIQFALIICVICLCYGLYQLILPSVKLKTYLKFDNMYHSGELFNTSNFDVYWSADNTTYVSVGEDYVVFGITDADDGHSVMAIHKRNLYEEDMYEDDYQRRYDGILDFVFYIIAYRYRRYGKEVVNYYEVCHKL
jgi:hypothetical protein